MTHYKLHLCRGLLGALIFGFAYSSYGADLGGLKTSVAVDLVGEYAIGDKKVQTLKYQPKETFKVRSAEFLFYAPIDPHFDGLLSFAAHPEGQQAFGTPEIHEAYVSSSKLLDGFRFKAGQYFLGVGRVNQIHQHDWPFISPTIMQKELFGSDEGVIDTGFEAASLLPLPFYLDLSLGVTNGNDFGHSHVEDKKPRTPTHYARLTTFFEPGGVQTQMALNYLARTSAVGEEMVMWGLDMTAKIKSFGRTKFLIQGELWQQEITLAGTKDKKQSGYGYVQYFATNNLAFGARYDYYTVASASSNSRTGQEYNLIYLNSEFSKFGLAYYKFSREQKNRDKESHAQIMLQTAFLLGAHPAHNF